MPRFKFGKTKLTANDTDCTFSFLKVKHKYYSTDISTYFEKSQNELPSMW
jgi:hypothetical protein